MVVLDWIFAGRPLLHLPIWSIYLVSLKYHHELSGKQFAIADLGMMVMLSLLASSAYYINQRNDFESDRINGKVAFLERGFISEKSLVVATVIALTAGLSLSMIYTKTIIAIALQLSLLALMYSIPPFRLKDRPLGGWFANAFGYGFLVPFTVMPEIDTNNAGMLGWDNPFYFFCAVGAIYILTTLSDRQGDAATGTTTVATALGRTRCYVLVLLQLGAATWLAWQSQYFLLAAISGLSFVAAIIGLLVSSDKMDLFATKFPILLLTMLAGVWYPLYIGFVVALILITRLYYRKRFGISYPRIA